MCLRPRGEADKRSAEPTYLRQNLMDDMSMNVGKPTINSILTENKPFRIDTQKMQHCRVEIVAVRLPFRGLMPPVIAVPVARARLDPSARQPGHNRGYREERTGHRSAKSVQGIPRQDLQIVISHDIWFLWLAHSGSLSSTVTRRMTRGSVPVAYGVERCSVQRLSHTTSSRGLQLCE